MSFTSLDFGSLIKITKYWTDFKSVVSTKSLLMQYEQDANAYYIFAVDGEIVYVCYIYKGTVPDPNNYSQGQNTTDSTDWTTNYQSTAGLKTTDSDRVASGNITNTQSVVINSNNSGTVNIGLTGTWTGTVVFEVTLDNTNWVSMVAMNVSTSAYVSSATANGNFELASAGYQQVRVRGNTVASGTVVVALEAAKESQSVSLIAPLPTGSNTIGTVNIGALNGLALDATVSTMSGKLPASIGQKTMSASLPVVIASDQSLVPITGSVGAIIVGYDGVANRNILTDSVGHLLVNISNSSIESNGVITSTQNIATNCVYATNLNFVITNTNNLTPWTGTLVFESSVDGTTWITLNVLNLATGLLVTSTTSNGNFEIANNGYVQVRVRGNSVTANSATILINQSIGPQFVTQADKGGSGSITSTQGIAVNSQGSGTVTIGIAGTWTGTLVFEVTIDSINWISYPAISLSSGSVVTSTTVNGNFELPCAGYEQVRVRGNTVASGTANIALNAGVAITSISLDTPVFGAGTAGVADTRVLTVQGIAGGTSLPVTLSNADRTAAGTITTTQTVVISSQGSSSVTIGITGTWTGTIVFESTVDNTNWVAITGVNSSTSIIGSTTTINGTFEINCAGYLQIRARGNTVATGTAAVAIDSSTGIQNISLGSPLPVGSNVIGGVTQSGTWNIGSVTTLPSLPTGANTIGAVTISGTPAVAQSGTWTVGLNTAIPTGANVIGGVTQSGAWNIGSITTLPSLPAGGNTIGAVTISGTPAVTGSGNFTVVQATASNLNATVTGTVTANIGTSSLALDATVTAMSGKLPASVGQKTMTASLPVVLASDQSSIPVSISATDISATGSITNTQNVAVNTQGTSTVSISLTGTWTGTVIFEKTVNGTSWVSAYVANPGTGTVVTLATANGIYEFSSAGYQQFRVRGGTVASGSLLVALNASDGVGDIAITSPLPVGSNVIGGVTQSGTWNIGSITTLPSLPTGANTIGAVTGSGSFTVAQATAANLNATVTGTVAATQSGSWNIGSITTLPSIPTGGNVIGSVTQSGTWNVGSITTLPALPTGSNTIGIVNQGTAASTANAWTTKITDGTNTSAVKAASTAAVSGDPALVVQISPNSPGLNISSPNTSGAGTLNGLNSTVNISLTNVRTIGFQLASGTLIGTIAAQMSIDGSTWTNTFFDLGSSSTKQSSITFASANTAQTGTIVGVGGAVQARIIVTAYTSGSASVTLSGVQLTDPSLLCAGPVGVALPPTVMSIGGTDGTLSRIIATDKSGRVLTTTALPAALNQGTASGFLVQAATTTSQVMDTVYTEQVTNGQRSIKSANAADASAGTGARTIKIIYYDQAMAGPYTETVTLNGTTAVVTVNTNICFIEDMFVMSAGTGNAAAGIISLYANTLGTGTVIGSIAANQIQTNWSHHYVGATVICNILLSSFANSANTATYTLRSKALAGTFYVPISDTIYQSSTMSSTIRNYTNTLKVVGPARIVAYVTPNAAGSATYYASYDYFDI